MRYARRIYRAINMMDTSGDYLIFAADDNAVLETVNYGANVGLRVVRIVEDKIEADFSGGVYVGQKCMFLLPVTIVGTPKVGDSIAASDGTWIIQTIEPPVWQDTWDCDCLRLTINSATGELLSLKRQVETTDAYGSRTIGYTITTGILGRIQDTNKDSVVDMFGKKGLLHDYVIYIMGQQDIQCGDILVSSTGIEYEIYMSDNEHRIDELQVFRAYIKP